MIKQNACAFLHIINSTVSSLIYPEFTQQNTSTGRAACFAEREAERTSSFSHDYTCMLDWHKTAILFHRHFIAQLFDIVQLAKVENSCRSQSSNQDIRVGKKRSQLGQVLRGTETSPAFSWVSQNHRLHWVGRDLKDHSFQPLVPLDQVYPSPI